MACTDEGIIPSKLSVHSYVLTAGQWESSHKLLKPRKVSMPALSLEPDAFSEGPDPALLLMSPQFSLPSSLEPNAQDPLQNLSSLCLENWLFVAVLMATTLAQAAISLSHGEHSSNGPLSTQWYEISLFPPQPFRNLVLYLFINSSP